MRERLVGARSRNLLRPAIVVGAISVVMTILAGCTSAPPAPGVQAAAYTAPQNYTIGPGDRLKVTVFAEPDLSGEFQVAGDGTLSLPLAGETQAAGLTADGVRQRIAGQLASGGFVRDPNVAVEVVGYRPFNVFGEVRDAGQYEYRPGMTVRDAIAMAGGYSYRADRSRVFIEKSGAGQEVKVPIGGTALYVQPGDSIRIPERFF